MQNQFFPAVFGNQQYIGTSHYGGDVAKTAAAGAAQRKVLTPYSKLGVVGTGTETFDSPVGGMQGQVSVPTSIAPAEIIPITIDTTNEPEPVQVVLFDAKDLYKNARCNLGKSSSTGGLIYSGSKEYNKYDSIVMMMCSKKYVLHSLRVTVRPGGANPGVVTMDMPIRIWRGNLYNREYQDAINPIDHISSIQYDSGIADIALTDDKALLDEFTAWIMDIEPGLIVNLRGYVALRSA
ncbi:MAG: hypothetical protein NXI23_14485 [Bacteroidetes bacterium]|nr:hypothetical protein [Bacteroidota bacterium]